MFCGVCDHRDINYTEMAYEAIRSRKNVYFVTFIVNLIYLNAGMTLTWTSPTIPRLQEPNKVLVITPSQGNYITTGASIGVILGPLISGLLTSYIGRKKSIYIIICSYVLHWFLLWLALSVECLWFGRLIGGFSMGTSLATLPLYIAEISEADIRGLLNSIPMSVRSFGFLWNYIAGPYVSYMNLIYSCSLVPVVLLILGLFLPETPYYLISTGKKAKALKTLCWLRSASREDVYQEFVKIQDSIEKANAEKTSVMWLFKNPVNLRAMCLGAAARFSLSSCGFFTILINMESIFIAADIGVSSSVACIIVGSVIFCTATTSPFITKSYGYKKPFVSSLIALSFILGVLGLYFMLLQHGYIHSWLTYVPVVCLIIHATLISFGVSNTAFALTGEMFPPNLRAAGSALTNTFGFLMSNLLVVYYFAVKDITGLYTVFWTLSMLTLIAAIFHLVCLPETSRLSLEEIQEKLKKPLLKRNRKRNEVY